MIRISISYFWIPSLSCDLILCDIQKMGGKKDLILYVALETLRIGEIFHLPVFLESGWERTGIFPDTSALCCRSWNGLTRSPPFTICGENGTFCCFSYEVKICPNCDHNTVTSVKLFSWSD